MTHSFRLIASFTLCLICASTSYAVETPDEMLPNPILEAKAQSLGQQLRCLVCQNETIEDSSAPLARDLRHIVRQQLQQGHSPAEIKRWMTQHYGEFIHLKPSFSGVTIFLWLTPLLSLTLAYLLARPLWRRPAHIAEPLSEKEKLRLHNLITKN